MGEASAAACPPPPIMEDPDEILARWLDDEDRRDEAFFRLAKVLSEAAIIPEDLVTQHVIAYGSYKARRTPELSPIELRVIEAFSYGLEYRMVADLLDLSLESIKGHMRAIRYKLCAKNTVHAVAIALRNGVIN